MMSRIIPLHRASEIERRQKRTQGRWARAYGRAAKLVMKKGWPDCREQVTRIWWHARMDAWRCNAPDFPEFVGDVLYAVEKVQCAV